MMLEKEGDHATEESEIKAIKAVGSLFMMRHLLTELNIYLKKRRLV